MELQEQELSETNSTGKYIFDNLRPDTYYLKFTAPYGYVITVKDSAHSSDSNDSDVNGELTANGRTGDYVIDSGENNRSVDAGFYIPAISR